MTISNTMSKPFDEQCDYSVINSPKACPPKFEYEYSILNDLIWKIKIQRNIDYKSISRSWSISHSFRITDINPAIPA